ncbi:MAG TPA: hypothetical protein P5186_20935 [Candidatus Paceibacterota bacterium]|nr:hypothetical protein [Verrucomicrobiota bacterium]HRY50523.1 hypothetical protein [Candidatus Paceibacterota bacterium]
MNKKRKPMPVMLSAQPAAEPKEPSSVDRRPASVSRPGSKNRRGGLLMLWLVGLAGLGFFASALDTGATQPPLAIDNLTDKSTHDLRVWFRIPSLPGYRYRVLLDGNPLPTDLTHSVENVDYHELSVTRTSLADGAVSNRLVRFIVQSERGSPENGLIRWTPYPGIPSTDAEFAGARLRVTLPAAYPPGLPIPVIAWVDDNEGRERRANGVVVANGYEAQPIQIRRGVGSGFLPATNTAGLLNYEARLLSLRDSKTIRIDAQSSWTSVSGALTGATTWASDSRIFIEDHVLIPEGSILTVEAGSIIKLNPLVNITNNGRIQIQGSTDRPVVFTATNVVWPERPTGAWGGFLLRGKTAEITASHAVFAGGGGGEDFDFSPGSSHRSEQAVFLLHAGARAWLTNCYILNTAGQVGNGHDSDLTLDHCLIQRAITAGEYVGGTIAINHSALIEFPADTGEVDEDSANADYDAIYFTEGTHLLMNSLLGYCLDDAIDSGSGGAGTVFVTNCWIESALHEAQAWSGEGRKTWTYDTVVINSGQGIECGYSSGHNTPDCYAERLLTTGNAVGARVGDNYDWSYNGFLRLTNCLVLHNYRDVFLKTWNAVGSGLQSNSWVDRLNQIEIRSSLLTTPWNLQPDNTLWNPGENAARLAPFMTTPASAPVGVGFAVRTLQFAMADLFAGVPVRLSTFTTHRVLVEYLFETDGAPLASGSIEFNPGETVKRILPAGFDVTACDQLKIRLLGASGGELTGETEVTFTGLWPAPLVSLWAATNNLPMGRLAEGSLVKLSAPAGHEVRVDYAYSAKDQILAAGTVTFAPGETARQIDPAALDIAGQESIRLSLAHPQGASLTGLTTVFYGTAPLLVAFDIPGPQLDLATMANGLPVILNQPVSSAVSIEFRCESPAGLLTNGTLVFSPGQTRQTISLPAVDPTGHPLIWVSLISPSPVELIEPRSALYLPSAIGPSPFLVRNNSDWRYLDTGIDPGGSWAQAAFDDSHWSNGLAELGFGDDDEATTLREEGVNGENTITFYFRKMFAVDNPGWFTNLNLQLRRDDGGVVYLNGREAYRSPTLPPAPWVITPQTLATNLSVSSAPSDNTVDQVRLDPSFLVGGANLVAVEIHQHRASSSDISFDLALTGEPVPPAPPQRLYWAQFGGQSMLAWGNPSAGLERADTVVGPWRRVTGATSPHKLDPSAGSSFYRLRQ